MRMPEIIKAEYPAENRTIVHRQWMNSSVSDAELIERFEEWGTRYPDHSEWGLFFCEKKNGNGWTLTFTRYCRKVSVNGKMMKWADNIYVYFTPTENGLRVMGRFGKKQGWGLSGVSKLLKRQDAGYQWKKFLAENFQAKDFIPQAEYLVQDSHGIQLGLYGEELPGPDMMACIQMTPYVLGLIARHPGAKGVMNEIFKDTKQGIPKDIFNGALQRPMDLPTLATYVYIARAFSGYGEAGLEFVRRLTTPIMDQGCLPGVTRDIRFYGEFFRHSRHSINKLRPLFEGNDGCCVISYKVRDVATMLGKLDRKNRKMVRDWYRGSRSIQELHDYLSAVIQRMQHEDRLINVKKLSQFQGDVGNGIACVVPKSTHDLLNWGSEANICIGSYADRVLQGGTYCFAFARDGVNIGYAEVSTEMRLKQLLGKYNKPLDPDIKEPIVVYLKKKGVDTSNYWGMDDLQF